MTTARRPTVRRYGLSAATAMAVAWVFTAPAIAQETPNPQLPRGYAHSPLNTDADNAAIFQRALDARQRNEEQGRRERDARESRDRQVRDADRQRQENQRDAQRRQAELQREREAERRRDADDRRRQDDRGRWDRNDDRNRGGYRYQNNDYRPQGRPPPSYYFRDEDNRRLRDYYRNDFRRIEPGRRSVLRVGTQLAPGYQSYLQPVPVNVYGQLPPPPPGYQMGYYQGYTVVYDPATSIILSFLDLMN